MFQKVTPKAVRNSHEGIVLTLCVNCSTDIETLVLRSQVSGAPALTED